MAEKYDFLETALTGAFDIWGDAGYFVLTKETLTIMETHPTLIAKELEDAIIKKSKEMGKNFEFSVAEGIHPDLGECFYIHWREVPPLSE